MYHIYINYTMSDTSSHTWSFASMLKQILDKKKCSCWVDIACTICFNTSPWAKWMRYLVGKKTPVWFFYCFANTNLHLFQSIISEVNYLTLCIHKWHYPLLVNFILIIKSSKHSKEQGKTFKGARENMYLHVTFFSTIDGI
jgi:hypothetical protein